MAAAEEDGVYGLARVFFNAATKTSTDSEDILPQEVSSSRQETTGSGSRYFCVWLSAAQRRYRMD